MQSRDYSYYIERAKQVQGFKYDNQVDAALGFKGSMTTILKKGKANISEEKMLELASLAGENPLIALLDLNVMRSTGAAKTAYEKLYKGLSKTANLLGVVLFLSLFSAPSNAAYHSVQNDSVAKTEIYIITQLLRQYA